MADQQEQAQEQAQPPVPEYEGWNVNDGAGGDKDEDEEEGPPFDLHALLNFCQTALADSGESRGFPAPVFHTIPMPDGGAIVCLGTAPVATQPTQPVTTPAAPPATKPAATPSQEKEEEEEEEPARLSVKELKALLAARGVSMAGMLERADLERACRESAP